jgi:hypothetical protein
VWKKGGEKWRLHPLIHTQLRLTLALDMVSCQRNKKAEPKLRGADCRKEYGERLTVTDFTF